jgi:ABC-type Zn2+ transport system substrate-binding protein/surface adhesin
MYHQQDMTSNHMQTSPDINQQHHHQQSQQQQQQQHHHHQQQQQAGNVDLRSYLELSESLAPLEDEQLGNFGALNLGIPLNLQECAFESSELDQYLPQQQQQLSQQSPANIHQYNSQASASSQWLINRLAYQ